MHNQELKPFAWRYVFWLAPVLALAGCGSFFHQFASKPRPVISKSAQAEGYVEQMALAQLALMKQPDNPVALKSHVKKLNAYAAGKTPRSLQMAVLELEYTLQGESEKHTLVVPVTVAATQPKFTALQHVSQPFSAIRHTLHDMRAYEVSVTLPESKFPKEDASALRQQLKSQQQIIMAGAQPLSTIENARLQLQLVRFFLQNRMRDSAYLALENAKEALAAMAEKSPDVDIGALSQEADTLEKALHKAMPYKL